MTRIVSNSTRTTLPSPRASVIAMMTTMAGFTASACQESQRPSTTCTLSAGPAGLPVLFRQARVDRVREGATLVPEANQVAGPRCTGSEDQCEVVDDLDALFGGGDVEGPGGITKQQVCPDLSGRARCVSPPAASTLAPCGTSACPNVQIALDESPSGRTLVLFYDDPSCHRPPRREACRATPGPCYYRVYAVSTELAGPTP